MKNQTTDQRYLAFTLAQSQFAMPLLSVREVIALPEITAIPKTSPHMPGITNLRGRIITLFDLRVKFGRPVTQTYDTAVIICDYEGQAVGFVVDSINLVLNAPPENITPPENLTGLPADLVRGVIRRDERLVLLVEFERLLGAVDKSVLRPVAEGAA